MTALSNQVTPRSARIDALRGIAVFGILLVNVWSFIWGFESLRYGVLPATASIFDVLSIAFTAFFAEQKGKDRIKFLLGEECSERDSQHIEDGRRRW